ncbi:hypothetical protein GCM10012284_46740 [Mangrovihabitans endophyticus]|uniref:Methyltransferase domain-containing protein n=1 Tax=Mangrovihabitans endophyticus TaxID=1751298 RepID=A0A8J3FQF7_9ACTN|nr:hypothetical protein GCM10012284_46740 [Mangrovihabitans endophyticus]
MVKDWVRWHQDYETPDSSLSRRLVVVQEFLVRALTEAPAEPGGQRRLISLCAGDGRDVLPVLARHDSGRTVRAVLAELDPALAERARTTAGELNLPHVDVRTGDAGLIDTYLDAVPAHLVMTCGVFGNIGDEDARRTIAALPDLLVAGGIVIWTRGRGNGSADPSSRVRAHFAENGFKELAFTQPTDARFRVGMNRLVGDSSSARQPPRRLFAFA